MILFSSEVTLSLSIMNEKVDLMIDVQLYSPDCSLRNEGSIASLWYAVPKADGEVEVRICPDGFLNLMMTSTGISTSGFSSTEQVRVTSDPIGRIGFGLLLLTVTLIGDGTEF